VAAFAQLVATVAVHEASHTLGLVAHGEAPAGLFGGAAGDVADHNVTPAGDTPPRSFLMNAGTSFGFAELTGRHGRALPVFRAMNLAYLRGRIVLGPAPDGPGQAPRIAATRQSRAASMSGRSDARRFRTR
jgi:hypothetical protein